MKEVTHNQVETSEFAESVTGVSIPGTWPTAPQPPAPTAGQSNVVIAIPQVTPTASTSQKR